MKEKNRSKIKILRLIGVIAIILILVALISQVSYYKKERQIATIKLGESTRSQIETILGTPIHMANQEEGAICDDYEVEKITKSPLFIANIEKGVLSCLQVSPQSKYLKRCVYLGNPSILRFRFEDSIELFYNEDETVCSFIRYGL